MLDLTPGSPEWCRRVSPSKAAAILGVSPFDSQRSMWHKMRGEVPWDEENEAMERGTLCEPAVLAWWRKHHEHTDWREQVSLMVGDWCAATPDAVALVDDDLEMVEAKTASADAMDGWGDPGTDQIPVYYLTQVYLAMHICHLNGLPVVRSNVPVLGGRRLLFSNYVVEYDAAIGADLMERMEAWSIALTADTPPPLDDTTHTYNAVRKVHRDIDAKAEVELTEAEAVALVEANSAQKDWEARLRLAKSTVLKRMGRANYAVCNGTRIARRQPDGPGRTKFVPVAKTTDFLNTETEQAS